MTTNEICTAIESEGVFCNIRHTPNGFTGATLITELVDGEFRQISDRHRVVIMSGDEAATVYDY